MFQLASFQVLDERTVLAMEKTGTVKVEVPSVSFKSIIPVVPKNEEAVVGGGPHLDGMQRTACATLGLEEQGDGVRVPTRVLQQVGGHLWGGSPILFKDNVQSNEGLFSFL